MGPSLKIAEPLHASGVNAYDVNAIRADFPILSRTVYGKPLVFLDSGASAQKPRQVIDRMKDLLEQDYANVHRGLHYLSGAATDAYEGARERVRQFINAASVEEVVFTKNATEGINLVASSYGRTVLGEGDEVIISAMEHHANIVPWQLLRDEKKIVLKIAPIDEDGNFLVDAFAELLGPRTKLVAVTHISNVLGTVVPVRQVIDLAHARGVPVLLDGSQAAVHMPVDMQALDVDFYAFTGHKLYGPSGIGVLYAKREHLDAMPPYQGGGDMIRSVSFEKTVFNDLPYKFEAGTPPIMEAVGLGAAIDYVQGIGHDLIGRHEAELLAYATERLGAVPGLTIHGQAQDKASIVSFTLDCAHPHDVATIVDRKGVAVRAGHHCAEPLMDRLGLPGTVRASFGLYNTKAEVDILADALMNVRALFA